MHKFFVDKDQINLTEIEIIGKDVKHIRDVLRLKLHDKIIISSNNINYSCEIIEKHFYPIATYRSVVKINEQKKEQSKLDRWNQITEEAAKQCKRDYIPKVDNILSFDDMIKLLDGQDNIIVPYESEDGLSLGKGLENITGNKIHLIIGPEGGFEQSEIEKLKGIGGKIVTLGQRILRTETAGFVASTIILYQLGNLGVI